MSKILTFLKEMNGWKYVFTICMTIGVSFMNLRDGQIKLETQFQAYQKQYDAKEAAQDKRADEIKADLGKDMAEIKNDIKQILRDGARNGRK